jgi:hypothetical protein
MFHPGFRGQAPLTLSFFGSSTSTGGSPAILTLPASIIAGDLILYGNWSRDNTFATSLVAPTGAGGGWTLIVDETAGPPNPAPECRANAWAKIATGVEGGANPGGTNGGVENNRWSLVFRPNRPIISAVAASVHSQQTDSAPSSQTIAASAGAPPLVAVAGYRSSAAVSARNFSPAADAEITPSTIAYVKYKIFNGAPADVTASMNDDGNRNTPWSFYIACVG